MQVPRVIRRNAKGIFDGVFMLLCLWIALGYLNDERWFFGFAWIGLCIFVGVGWTIRNIRDNAIRKVEYHLEPRGLVAVVNLIQDEEMRGWWTAKPDQEFNRTFNVEEVRSGTYFLIEMEPNGN